jgi:hypothetical protein
MQKPPDLIPLFLKRRGSFSRGVVRGLKISRIPWPRPAEPPPWLVLFSPEGGKLGAKSEELRVQKKLILLYALCSMLYTLKL